MDRRLPGIYLDVPHDDYHADRSAVSCSGIKHFLRSPAHFQAYLAEQYRETEAKRFGRIYHRYVLEPDDCNLVLAPDIDKRSKAGKDAWELAEQEAVDCRGELVKHTDAATLSAMRDALYAHPVARRLLFAPGQAESTVIWYDAASGERCKCRPDYWRQDRIIVDLKTCEDASPSAFSRSCANYGYDVQAALYTDGVETAAGDDVAGFVFLAQEKAPPYAVAAYTLDVESVHLGRAKFQRALLGIAECKIMRKWPAYPERIESLSLPRWAMKQGEEAA